MGECSKYPLLMSVNVKVVTYIALQNCWEYRMELVVIKSKFQVLLFPSVRSVIYVNMVYTYHMSSLESSSPRSQQ